MIITSLLRKRIIYLIFLIFLIYMYKPTIIFKPNGKLREYGIGNDHEGYKKTFYTFQFVIILCVVIVMYLVR
jgi:hypothetical protein